MSSTVGKIIKCKAAVAWEKNQPMTIEEIEVAPPKSKEIRVKIIATGICHSDLSAWRGVLPFAKFPTVLGHEASGIVESVGEGITSVKVGDHVLSCFLPQCNECPMCLSPKTNLCLKFVQASEKVGVMDDGTIRLSCDGKPIYHFLGCSTFAEFAVFSEGWFSKINKEAPPDKVCILSCGVTTGYGGPVKVAKVHPGSTCVVFGLGAVGLGAVMGCKVQGATKIIGVDINNGKKEIAEKFGITEFVNPSDFDKPVDQVLLQKTQIGCDYAFECIGNVEVAQSALNACRIGEGQCVVIGVPPFGNNITVDPYQVLFGRVLTGCLLGGFKAQEVPGIVEDYLNKKIMVDEFITCTLSLKEVNKAFDYMVEGKSLKTVLKL